MSTDQACRADEADIDKLRRHVRILVDLGRLAARNFALDRFLDQAVVQVARAVEIDHVKVMRYRCRTGFRGVRLRGHATTAATRAPHSFAQRRSPRSQWNFRRREGQPQLVPRNPKNALADSQVGNSVAAAAREGQGTGKVQPSEVLEPRERRKLDLRSAERAQVAAEPIGISTAEEIVQPRMRALPNGNRAGQQRPTRRCQRQPPAAPVRRVRRDLD